MKSKRPNNLIALLAITLIALSSIGFFSDLDFLLDNCTQFRLVYLIASIIFLALAIYLGRPVLCLLTGIALLINLTDVLPLYLPTSINQSRKPALKILSMNLWQQRNERYEAAIRCVRHYDPDIVCLNEIDLTWIDTFKKLPQYRYHIGEGGTGGCAVYSKTPLVQLYALCDTPTLNDIYCKVKFDNRDLFLIATHPPSPSNQDNWRRRNQTYATLTQQIAATTNNVVMIGDLNSTPWSPYFRKLIRKTALHDSEFGHGVQPTWSTLLLSPLFPIDHCLTSPALVATSRRTGPDIGSDHLPLYVELTFRE